MQTTELKHTPGPWAVLEWPATPNVVGIFQASRDTTDCTFATCSGMANARLIAAAPDLLAVCETLVAIWSAYPGGWTTGIGNAVRAAVAKAHGVGR